ncbi:MULTISPECIES: response regulator [Micromonospora]|uniref:Two component transcriptional regulator, LuxR family n=1 Tax=Micromonospora yangpuensis TaxID=683228 RepID=A0A1C6UL65_9ACTN|nr:response regulator transcription factor [Micromonospora yangpuensis]GGM17666.1 DNA-binding response regulator [Micromonospora yangpuensis]SCL54790.1 two component transcriptional regulator, LuxR family [Micromonospora yangpuensis]
MNRGDAAVTVALADDQTLFRDGVREILATNPGLRVVGEAAHGEAAIALCVERQPDVLLLDVEMPGPGTAAVLLQLRRLCPHTRTVVLTMHDDADIVHEAIECGAVAYLIKTIHRAELIAAVIAAAGESATVRLSVSRRTVERLVKQRRPTCEGTLTERELEVLRLTAQALSNAQIATRLRITEATVKRHLTNIYGKLDAVSRVDAVRKATAAHLIEGDQGKPIK